MPGSPFERDFDQPPRDDRRLDERNGAAVRLELRASARQPGEEHGAEESLEEPGYGHGV